MLKPLRLVLLNLLLLLASCSTTSYCFFW